jgi:hypothetical protein
VQVIDKSGTTVPGIALTPRHRLVIVSLWSRADQAREWNLRVMGTDARKRKDVELIYPQVMLP